MLPVLKVKLKRERAEALLIAARQLAAQMRIYVDLQGEANNDGHDLLLLQHLLLLIEQIEKRMSVSLTGVTLRFDCAAACGFVLVWGSFLGSLDLYTAGIVRGILGDIDRAKVNG
ncbi:hypothetical protein EBZ39_03605 [bacterium]|nr:hypothetical protein [bacterium]